MKWKTIKSEDGKSKNAIFSCAGISKRGQLAFKVAKKLAEKGYGDNY